MESSSGRKGMSLDPFSNWQFSLRLEGACGRVSKACKNLMSKFSLEGGHHHSGPAYALYEKSFIDAFSSISYSD